MKGLLELLGRLALSAIFLASGVQKVFHFDDTVTAMTKEGVPEPTYLLIAAIAALIIGSVLVILGLKTRLGALMLFCFLGAATYWFHDFWNMPAEQVQMQQIHFMKNIALMGAMLLLIERGAGAMSLDAKRRHAKD
ncbi:MAG: DoxX family protein [Planctomycetes bacterium]|nr:DoxX family protein [Planctomycetota bacterium]